MPSDTMPYDPIKLDRIIVVGTDHYWKFRRVASDGTPFVPTEAHAQIRNVDRTVLWLDLDTEIDPVAGWISIVIPEEDTSGPKWDTRSDGVWDLECVMSDVKHRWAYGDVCVSAETTK
jgi:hypothetical protein